jgi:hypothetical protein
MVMLKPSEPKYVPATQSLHAVVPAPKRRGQGRVRGIQSSPITVSKGNGLVPGDLIKI